ncbi:MAG: hypothetical protein SFZ02_05735 [bacterium]|nr:hypothetical protein [bacterium]
MPLHVEWYIPYRVTDARVWGVFTVEEVQQMSDIFVKYLTEASIHAPNTTPHIIFDSTENISMPPIYRMMTQALPVLRFKNRGIMFHITKNNTMRSLMELTAHVTKFKLRTFATREEAIRALEAVLIAEGLNINQNK